MEKSEESKLRPNARVVQASANGVRLLNLTLLLKGLRACAGCDEHSHKSSHTVRLSLHPMLLPSLCGSVAQGGRDFLEDSKA